MPQELIHPDALQSLLDGTHGSPFDILGPHDAAKGKVSVRIFRPNATAAHLLVGKKRVAMQQLHPAGIYEATVTGDTHLAYQCAATYPDGWVETFHDPYRYPPMHITDYERYLFGEGRYLYGYEKFGAHPLTLDGVDGVQFAVWSPNARRISVVGTFNHWDGRAHPMQMTGNGLWELFIPGLKDGTVYRYDVLSHVSGYRMQKSDPYGYAAELRPANASIVADMAYSWGDDAWMQARPTHKAETQAMMTYEVHLGSWRRKPDGTWLNYRDLAHELVAYAVDMGYTHLELLPVLEHALDASWGYQVTGYYAATSRYGSPTDFMYFVDYCHQHGIGVILDWVPAHFPKDGHALSYFDGTHLYEHNHPLQREHPDWGTYIFNYGRNEVRNFLLSNALFWLKVFHVDGLRVDAVSSMIYLDFSRQPGQWIPNQHGGRENLEAINFLKEFNDTVHAECPGCYTIAEESTAWPMISRPTYLGGLGFDFKWNMGWMHDTLAYVKQDPIYRRFHHNKITFSLFYAFNENFVLSLSHDEVVHLKKSLISKMPGDWWQEFATLRAMFGFQTTHPGKKLTFMGGEIAQWREWHETRQLDWDLLALPTHKGIQNWVRDLNNLYKAQPALYQRDFDHSGFKWCDANDADNSVYSYLRFGDNPADALLVLLNFTPIVRQNYRVGVPELGHYAELLNSDSAHYGGGNVGNFGGVGAEEVRHLEWSYSLRVTLPPLSCVVLQRVMPPADLQAISAEGTDEEATPKSDDGRLHPLINTAVLQTLEDMSVVVATE